jgi:glycosyltransferase involved in cell wall biosynthesis
MDTLRNMATLTRIVLSERFDVVHSFGRIAYMAALLPLAIPKLMTYQREISPRSVKLGNLLSRGSLQFSAISVQMMREVQSLGRWHLVYNGVSLSAYEFSQTVASDAPLVFLGRIEPIKGPHLAIEIARRSGRKLVIAGNISPGFESYFDQQIKPWLGGSEVSYIGAVNDGQKNRLLGSAAALLMPILWEEPFGIVMAEALACGTPVLGLARGAVPEVVEHNVTGVAAQDVNELVSAVARINDFSRFACRLRAEHLFSDKAIVGAYESLYLSLIKR